VTRSAGEPDDDVRRVLVVAAHPDDIDFGCGGSVAVWTAAGIEVSYCIITDGDAGGGFDPDVPRSEIGGVRQHEQRKAAAVLGVTEIAFLGYPDGRLTVTLQLRRDIARVIRQLRPDRVVTQPPVRDLRNMYGSHPDHTATGEATLCAVYPDARNPFAHPELLAVDGLAAHTVGQTWVMSNNEHAEHYVDITGTIDLKIAALREHVSQTAHMDLERAMRGWGARQAVGAGWTDGRLAEGFLLLNTR
jgi:LmbE family N-acetylglucosaminyl deacetylase